MAIGTSNAYSGPYLANGSTTAFPFTFAVLAANQVSVILRSSAGVDTTVSPSAYTVSLNGSAPTTGTVTFGTAPASGSSIYILLAPEFASDANFADGSAWLAKPVNDGYDGSALRDQVLARDIGRALLAPVGEVPPALPTAANRANKFLVFDASGNPSTSSGTGADAGLRTDLAAATGSSLIGRKRTGTGAVVRSLDAIIDDSIPVHPKDFGCACDGVTDDTANLAKMLASGYTKFDGGGLTYKISAGLSQIFPKDSSVEIKNFNFVSAGVPNNTAFLTVGGQLSGSPMTCNAVASGATSITLTSGSAAAGDVLLLQSSDLWSDTAVNKYPSVTMGEWVSVLSVAGSVLALAAPVRYDYSTSPNVTKALMPRRVLVENVTGTSDSTTYAHNAVTISYTQDAVAKNVVSIKCCYAAVLMDWNVYSYNEDCAAFDPPNAPSVGLNYCIVIGHAHRQATSIRPRGRGCRHVVAHGGYQGVIASCTVIDPVGDNQFEGIVDSHASVDEQFVLFGNTRISGSANSKIISTQARKLTVLGCRAYNVANAIAWNPACTAYPCSLTVADADVEAYTTALLVGLSTTQNCESINITGRFIGGLGGVSGDGVQFTHSTQLNIAPTATPGRIKNLYFRGQAKGFQRGFYALAGSQNQKIDNIDAQGTFSVYDTATGHFPFYLSFINNSDMKSARVRGVIENGERGVLLLKVDRADVEVMSFGCAGEPIYNYQSGEGDALDRYNLRATGYASGGASLGAKRGSVTVNGTTPVTVNTAAIRSGSRVWFQLATAGGTVGVPRVGTIVSGTSFAVSSGASDTSTYWWWLENPVTGP